MKTPLDTLVSRIEILGITHRQVLALRYVNGLDIKATASVIGASEREVKRSIKILGGKFVKNLFGVYFGDEKILQEIDKNADQHIEFLLEYDGDKGKSKKEIEENREYHANKFLNYIEDRRKGSRQKESKASNKFVFTEIEIEILRKYWCWQIYVPKSFTDTDIADYRNNIEELYYKQAERFLLATLEAQGKDFIECFGEFLFYYIEGFTIDQMAEMLGVSRKEVFRRFQKARKWLDFVMASYYKLEKLPYDGKEKYLPNDEAFKDFIHLCFQQKNENNPSPELIDKIMSNYRKNHPE